ncbi:MULTISPECIES: LuxR C-terminal-related transcriptional regulator [Pseudomonas]|uniref:PAS domain S-box n=1 Tax=Pseudomonas asplenii TaxID=53407 RepID=A0A0N0E3N8_9PSED|nr:MULTISPECIES: LuxR C-terminal-related transcriptional regulator [Pseudomonas]KPA90296.1 PAS domain S-box [Pseudomonas fuscovaginae]KPA96542.1 PAS domain S-box [Pseudomonas fuscovaginae]
MSAIVQQQDLQRLAFMASPAPQLITGDRVILDCNAAFLELFGYSREELLGQLTLLIHPSPDDYRAFGTRSRNGLRRSKSGSYSDERLLQRKDGEVFWARSQGYTLTPSDPFKLIVWHLERLGRMQRIAVDLTPREREVSMHIVKGLTCKEVAKQLQISHRTVEVHRARLMKKLQARNSVELVSKIILVD